MGTVAADILDRLESVTTAFPDTDGVLTGLVTALMTPVQIVEDITRDQDDGTPAFQTWRDPDRTPAAMLGWLEQHNGTVSPPSATEQERRDRVKHNPGFDDGKTSSLKAEVARTLTGSQTVRVLKHVDGFATRMTVVTRTSETPDPAATLAAALRQKPAGIRLTHVISDFALIDDWTLPIDDVTAPIDDLELDDVT